MKRTDTLNINRTGKVGDCKLDYKDGRDNQLSRFLPSCLETVTSQPLRTMVVGHKIMMVFRLLRLATVSTVDKNAVNLQNLNGEVLGSELLEIGFG